MRPDSIKFSADTLVAVFHAAFEAEERTRLEGGSAEPYYAPGSPSIIYFREDFTRSALHEVAHWCVAGARRRRLPDYGYWYSPDGRAEDRQDAFFAVEARPQAIEALFCDACCIEFVPSVDNVDLAIGKEQLRAFSGRIVSWRRHFEGQGLPPRAERFRRGLLKYKASACAVEPCDT